MLVRHRLTAGQSTTSCLMGMYSRLAGACNSLQLTYVHLSLWPLAGVIDYRTCAHFPPRLASQICLITTETLASYRVQISDPNFCHWPVMDGTWFCTCRIFVRLSCGVDAISPNQIRIQISIYNVRLKLLPPIFLRIQNDRWARFYQVQYFNAFRSLVGTAH